MAGNWVYPFQFRRHVEYLKRKFKQGDILHPTDIKDNEFLITFDDALEGVYKFAYPVMQEMGIKGIVFVITGFIGKRNTWDANFGTHVRHLEKRQITELSNSGWIIGSHGITHRSFKFLRRDEVRREVEYSKKLLEDMVGKPVEYFSYPFGQATGHAEEVLRECGYKYAFTGISFGFKRLNHYRIPRIPVFITDTSIRLKLSKISYFEDIIFSLPSNLTPIYQFIVSKVLSPRRL